MSEPIHGMLVLSRQIDQTIVIGDGADQIRITVTDIRRGGKVRIGIDAPKHLPVHREEVYRAIRARRPAAAAQKAGVPCT